MLVIEICDAKSGRPPTFSEWRVANESITQQIRGEFEVEVASYEWRVNQSPLQIRRGLSFGEGLQTLLLSGEGRRFTACRSSQRRGRTRLGAVPGRGLPACRGDERLPLHFEQAECLGRYPGWGDRACTKRAAWPLPCRRDFGGAATIGSYCSALGNRD